LVPIGVELVLLHRDKCYVILVNNIETLINTGRPWTVRKPANKDAIIAAVKQGPWKSSHDVPREFGLSQLMVLEVLQDD
jgi:hypothetical protein